MQRATAQREEPAMVASAALACCYKALCDAPDRGSRFRAASLLRARLAEIDFFLRLCPTLLSRAAAFRVFSDTRPFFGWARSTPARRALESPIAIACFADAAPCLPSRM